MFSEQETDWTPSYSELEIYPHGATTIPVYELSLTLNPTERRKRLQKFRWRAEVLARRSNTCSDHYGRNSARS